MGGLRLSSIRRLLLLPALAGVSAGFSDDAAYRYYQIAGAAYCGDDALSAWKCRPCQTSNLTMAELRVWYNKTTDARAFTAAFTPRGGATFVALSWRGTEGLENWIENLRFFKTDRGMSCSGCRVHSGFYNVWA